MSAVVLALILSLTVHFDPMLRWLQCQWRIVDCYETTRGTECVVKRVC